MPHQLKMIPMTTTDFERFVETSSADYAEQCRLTGLPSLETSRPQARANLQALLPLGLATPGHYLMLLQEEESGASVGEIWFGEVTKDGETSAFLYDLTIDAEHRRRGFASAALELLLEEVRLRGLSSLSLNVFAHNEAAQALYRKAGFLASEITMVRTLSSD
ncbi:GNAT family N-acetyltransferase [Herbaspirillum rhizosphaerae]|uniref:GNAT family N-acetyltransferase n=1 Tax=Herbaspirillum rhizosphaerae TaxID=346179 RepID=UPI00067D31EC|nr:GNAT family N-acetyltransferase [Herbaspirillum rhizosphaerae]